MNAVQSFWITKDSVKSGGWINTRFEYISWSLSYYLLKKNFRNIHLHCNSEGHQMLITELGLPYDAVYKTLDGKAHIIEKSWVLAKIFTYSIQETPFVHVDGDVFWFTLPDEDFFEAEVFAQNLEMDEPMYKNVWLSLRKHMADLPEYLKTPNAGMALSANAGIMGGKNFRIFREFYQEAISFFEKNQTIFEEYEEDFEYIGTYMEQAFFVSLMNHLHTKIKFLKKPVFRNNFSEVLDFNRISPDSRTPAYIHLLGSNRYRLQYCNLMEFWLYRIWPQQLKKIDTLCQTNKQLKNNTLTLLNPQNEKKLPRIEWVFNTLKDAIDNPFIRTKQVFNLTVDNYSEPDFTKHAEAEKLADCIYFEKRRLAVLSTFLQNQDAESMYQHFETHLDFCSKNFAEIQDMRFELNHSKIIKSKYNWFNGLQYRSQNYWYNVITDSQVICFQEFLLDETNCIILELLTAPLSLDELSSAWSTVHSIDNTLKTRMMLHESLKTLIADNLIRIC